jgi:hypothetical protein
MAVYRPTRKETLRSSAEGYQGFPPSSQSQATFATRMAENGVPESTMLALMGHMRRSMFERYSHIRMTAKREALSGVTLHQKSENSEVVPMKVPVAEPSAAIQ